ncbi:MAG: hypothetical protein KAQ85_03790, partial [Thermodesulfovibrionia bacterium]|nr:hypothetical protein [Thermodesulfovibrionia bacterium]
SELDEYGGGDYSMMDDVGNGLYQLVEILKKVTLVEEDRDELLDEVFSYIKSGNAGMDDSLYDIVYASCKNDGELRELAKRFENLDQHWPIEHARRIYRRIGDSKQYLKLRNKHLRYGMDYYDLVAFYWETGEKIKAVETARKGMKLAEGRMDELRMFLADRAKEDGDREAYLDYIFAQRTDYLTLSSYKELEKECRKEEWVKYEGKIIDLLEKNFNIQAVKIYMYRKEYDMALRYFKSPFRSTYRIFGESELFSIAKRLEVLYPEEILAFYRSSVGNVNVSASRKIYAQNALAIMRVRRVLVDVMKRTDEWKKYAVPIKSNNVNRPAFQDEFARVIPDWKSL